MGALSFWYVWATGIRKKLINLTYKKGKIFRGGSNWPIFSFIFLGVANFKFNFLSHFLINFKNSCAYLGANFLNFLKHPQLFKFGCFWIKLCKKKEEFLGWLKLAHFQLHFLGGANFKFNFLSHFLINFKNSCAYLGANLLNFMKHPQLLKFWCFWMKLWKKEGKSAIQKMGQFEPPLKIFLF